MFIMLQSFNRIFTSSKDKDLSSEEHENVVELQIEQIIPNAYQPRTNFDEEKIEELARTIHTHGMIQPIVVRKIDEKKYELIAGERRLRAAKHLGWKTISAIIRNLNDTETASIALIENIQREELSVIEEARAYEQLLEMHSLTQEALAQRLGKSQSTIANRLRLLTLPDEVQQKLLEKQISERHARALMKLKDETLQVKFLHEIIEKQLTVREAEAAIEKWLTKDNEKPKRKQKRQIVSKDIRIVTNTIKRSLKLIEQTGVKVESEEEDLDDYYQITIRVKK